MTDQEDGEVEEREYGEIDNSVEIPDGDDKPEFVIKRKGKPDLILDALEVMMTMKAQGFLDDLIAKEKLSEQENIDLVNAFRKIAKLETVFNFTQSMLVFDKYMKYVEEVAEKLPQLQSLLDTTDSTSDVVPPEVLACRERDAKKAKESKAKSQSETATTAS